jgi:hypothetical protein
MSFTYIYMEMSQETSHRAILNKQKCLSSYSKNGELECKTGPFWGLRPVGGEKIHGKCGGD